MKEPDYPSLITIKGARQQKSRRRRQLARFFCPVLLHAFSVDDQNDTGNWHIIQAMQIAVAVLIALAFFACVHGDVSEWFYNIAPVMIVLANLTLHLPISLPLF